MAWKSTKEWHQRRRSSSKNGVKTHVRAFLVTFTPDDVTAGTAGAMFAPDVPRDGDKLNGDPFTIVTDIDVQPHENSMHIFVVEVTYTGNQFQALDVHPLDRPPEYTQSGDSTTENYFMDHSDPPKPFANSAADTFENTGTRDGGMLTAQVVMNLAYWDTFMSDDYRHTTNSDIVTIDNVSYAADVLRMGIITSTKTQETWQGEVVEYYKVTFPIKIDKGQHRDKELDQGFNTIKSVSKTIAGVPTDVNVKVPILDHTGLKINKPWPLDGQGHAKSSATDLPEELEFIPYRSVAWGPIGLR